MNRKSNSELHHDQDSALSRGDATVNVNVNVSINFMSVSLSYLVMSYHVISRHLSTRGKVMGDSSGWAKMSQIHPIGRYLRLIDRVCWW